MPPLAFLRRSLPARLLACDGGVCWGSPAGEGVARDEEAGGSGSGGLSGRSTGGPSGECYACTQPGVPAFHSTTCDQVHSPDWDADAGSSLVPVQAQQSSQPVSAAAAAAHHAGAAARWLFGPVLDPRSKRVQRWNRWILLGRAAALAVDPLFFYSLSIGRAGQPCLYMDAGLAAAVTALRTCADVAHLAHVLLQFRLAYVSRETLVVGCGKLVWDARAIAAHYARSVKGLCFDLFVILPIPQGINRILAEAVDAVHTYAATVPTYLSSKRKKGAIQWQGPIEEHLSEKNRNYVEGFNCRTCQSSAWTSKMWNIIVLFTFFYVLEISFLSRFAKKHIDLLYSFCFLNKAVHQILQVIFWLVIPKLIREEQVKLIMTILLLMFIFQFLPKIYHCIHIMRKMQKVTGYIFGSIWWGFGLNLFAYFIASHIAGGCWYVLAIQRIASCLQEECKRNNSCDLISLACSKEICFHPPWSSNVNGFACDTNITSFNQRNVSTCLSGKGSFAYGIYLGALPVISSNSLAVKVLYPIFWGLMTLSTFGNDLAPTSNGIEVIFSIINVLSGLMLFTLLIGNIQVFLHAVLARKRKMQLRFRDMEWWMRRRQLPSRLRQRVRKYERERWAAVTGDEEMEMIKDLPEGLRRDIKRYLCLELVKQVPLFHGMDDLILDNICDRLRPLVFSSGEKVIREGDPVQRMVFILQGKLRSMQPLTKGVVATCMLGAGNFLGDELLSWCLRRPFLDRLPASSATFECVEAAQAFCLDAPDLRFITEHFRYKFANEKLKRTARYYSSNWRTWAAVNIQLAWRRYRARTSATDLAALAAPPLAGGPDDGDRRLRHYAAMFMSLRPHDHLE